MHRISNNNNGSHVRRNNSPLRNTASITKSVRTVTPTVLVADDNDDTRSMFRTLLTNKGYRVIEAADGEEAVEITSRENPGLVLLDLGLPRMNGLSVIRRLRTEMKVLNVPVVVITGYDRHFDTAVAAGCDDYLLKPVDFTRLDAILEYYVPTTLKAQASGA